MALVDLDLVKKHLRVDWDDEDAVIEAYRQAAETTVVEYLDRVVLPVGSVLPDPDDENYDATAIIVTSPITAAVLLLTADAFDGRTPEASDNEALLPPVVRRLLAPYRIWRQFEETP